MDGNTSDAEHCGLMVIADDPTGQAKARFEIFHELQPEEYRAYLKACGRLQSAIDGSLITYVRQSLANLESIAEQIRHFMQTQPGLAALQASVDNWFANVVCYVLTFCSALHLYQEQSEGEVTRNYGDASDELVRMRNIFSDAYDNSFAYRLIYRLRNVLVHHSLQSVGLTLATAEDRTPAGLIVHRHTVRVPLKREIFLRAKRAVSAQIRQQLEEMAEDPNLLVLCPEALRAVEDVHRKIFRLVHADLLENARLVRELDVLFDDTPGVRALGRIPAWSGMPMQLPHTVLRAELFEYAKEINV
jgi:hypothetical protein